MKSQSKSLLILQITLVLEEQKMTLSTSFICFIVDPLGNLETTIQFSEISSQGAVGLGHCGRWERQVSTAVTLLWQGLGLRVAHCSSLIAWRAALASVVKAEGQRVQSWVLHLIWPGLKAWLAFTSCEKRVLLN